MILKAVSHFLINQWEDSFNYQCTVDSRIVLISFLPYSIYIPQLEKMVILF